MGTSTMGSDLHSDRQDKLLKLQARKKELEILLSAKNEELYKLCVQEVQLTGVMPPEAPLSPEVGHRERVDSGRSGGDDVRDGSEQRRPRPAPYAHDQDLNLRKNHSHRLSTPSISGLSTKSSQSRHHRRPETSCSNFFPSPPQDRSTETFSMHTSHTYPTLSSRHDLNSENMQADHNAMYKHPPMKMEYMNKIYYTPNPEMHKVNRLRETQFSSSHPDITTNYTHGNVTPQHAPVQQGNGLRSTPLLYQYASQLKSQNPHLSSLSHNHPLPVHPKRRAEGARRNTLQRTQTYHITSQSDYNQHLGHLADNYRSQQIYPHRSQQNIQEAPPDRVHVPPENAITLPNTIPLQERTNRNIHTPLQVSTDDYGHDMRRKYPDAISPVSQMSGYSQQSNFDSVSMNKFSPLSQMDLKVKEKQWYETALDSPNKPECSLPKKSSNLKRTSSIGNSQTYEIMMSPGHNAAMQSPNSPPLMSPPTAAVDSPNNMTVIEQGKCIPYREETKPFEMSDFYKYSTKFRQANNQKPNTVGGPNPGMGYNKLPMELPSYAQDNWHGQ